ncbi:MAG: toll/interleukin-1 receptor domain-containing protein [Chloroflexi bacterium]|nr:toll/interleukin-1 receptor domain-containing protein [Chloroflexota bacterium]
MPQVFFSHSWKDKQIVHHVKHALEQSLVKVWIDDSEIGGGEKLTQAVVSAIHKSKYFFMFLSNHYLASKWCIEEFDIACTGLRENQLTLMPILLEEESALNWELVREDQRAVMQALLKRIVYVKVDKYNPEASIANILGAFWKNELVRFEPIRQLVVGGTKVQLIQFQTQGDLPSDFLQTWDFNIETFVAHTENDPAPIQFGLPVAFAGKAPNWIIAFLAIPLKNLRTVFVYNNQSQDYICVFSLKSDNRLGQVLKAK